MPENENTDPTKSELTYILVFAFLLNALVIGGPLKSIGVYFIQFQNDLNISAGQTSIVITILFASFYVFGPVASIASNIFGIRIVLTLGCIMVAIGTIATAFCNNIYVIYITLGLITGAGACFSNTCALTVIGKIFTDKRSFANNVYSTGSAVAAIPLSPVLQYLIDVYGWRGSFLLFGGVLLHAVPISLLMVSKQISNKYFKKTQRRILDYKLLKSPMFLLLVAANGLYISSLISITIYLIRYAQAKSINNYLAASLSSVIAIIDIFLRPFTGYITSLNNIFGFKVHRSYIFAVACFVQALVVFLFAYTETFPGFVAVTASYAICLSFVGALPITILADYFGTQNLPSLLGLRSVIMGIITLAIPACIGIIVDRSNSYAIPFYSSSVLSITAGIFVTITKKMNNDVLRSVP